jgi:small subunit ribosomal protein S15
MSRMHSTAKGKSGSKKPIKKTVPAWTRYKAKEVEMLIAKMGKEGKTASAIGMILRDTYGIPDVRTLAEKKISDILEEKKLLPEVPEDLRALIKKAALVRLHLAENKLDMPALRGLQLTEAKIKRLIKYYKNSGRLPQGWKYEASKATRYLE